MGASLETIDLPLVGHGLLRVPLEMATIILSFLKILDEVILRGGVAIHLPRMLCSCWQVTRGHLGSW